MTTTHRATQLGLRTLLNLLTIGLAVMTVGIAWFMIQRETTVRHQDLVDRGLTIAAMMAKSSEYAVYTENQDALQRNIAGLSATPEIAYVAILNKGNQILLEQFFRPSATVLPTQLNRASSPVEPLSEEVITDGGDRFINIVAPVLSRTTSSSDQLFLESPDAGSPSSVIGYVRIIMSQQELREYLHQFFVVTGVVVCVVLSVGLLLALVLTRTITQPILSLTEVTGRIAEGRFEVDVPAGGAYEVDLLASSFRRMTIQLQTSQAQVLDYQRSLETKVTERTLQLEATTQEARRLAKDAQAANKAKSEFLANMSHEIRTPLNGVLGMAELLLTTQLPERQRHMVDTIHRSGTALLGIINDILDFSKIEAGKLELERINFGLRQTLEEAVELFAEPAGKKGLELTCFLPNDIPNAVIGDPVRLRQVLLNLVGNAVKFTERGDVSVRVHCLSQETDRVTLRCEVQDTGIGISEEAKKRLFSAFSQADGSTTRRFGGTGLGLAIVQQLVHLMGGEVGLESVPGHGSTFWFTVQLGYDPTRQALEATSIESLAGTRVLIVDDNATNLFILESQLKSWGAETISADSAAAALKHLQQTVIAGTPVDLAILDIHMPDVDGIELARVIKGDPNFRTISLLALSSVEPDSSSGQMNPSPFFAWLRKPARQSMLRDCLLRQRHASTEADPITVCTPSTPTACDKRILLTEDNPVNREVALAMLESIGCHVDLAENGRQAVEAVSKRQYDLVLMDCQMPVLDGFTATAEIRRHQRSIGAIRPVPIIALTAHAMEGDREKCLAAGMDDYLSKPFSQPQLLAIIQRWARNADSATLDKPATTHLVGMVTPAYSEPTHCLDEQVLQSLRQLRRPGRPDAYLRILTQYLGSSRQSIEAMRQQIAAHQADELFKTAHFLKSSSGMVGACTLAELLKQLEALGTANDLSSAESVFVMVSAEYQRVQHAIENLLAKEAA